MSRTRISLLTASLLILIAVTAYSGGWAIVTITDLPDYAVAGKPLTLTFAVRQHGVTLLDDLKPMVFVKSPDNRSSKIDAVRTARKGEYRFDLALTQPGEWNISIDSGFISYMNYSKETPSDTPKSPQAGYVSFPLKVLPAGSAPLTVSDRERGEHLFAVKGCAGCHGSGIGPDLTKKKLPTDYVKRVLADPTTAVNYKEEAFGQMPNLNLKPAEIAALAEFVANR